MINKFRLENGEFAGIGALEIKSIPHISILESEYNSKTKEEIAYQYKLDMQSLISELYQDYKSDKCDISYELLWLTTPVENQTYKAAIRMYMCVRGISANEAELEKRIYGSLQLIRSSLVNNKYDIEESKFEELNEQINKCNTEKSVVLSKEATFDSAPDGIKSKINDLSDELSVGDTRGNEACHYSPSDDIIRMNPNYDNGEYAEVFRHEYGHFADSKLGDLSTSNEFINAMNSDMDQFNNNPELKNQMLDDLSSNSAIDDRCISDILSGSFNNDTGIMDRYRSEGADYWRHSNDYWDGTNGPEFARDRETFANMFSIYSGQGRDDSIAFLEKYYPNTTKRFKSYF